MNREMKEKVLRAAQTFLESKGYDIVESEYECKIGSMDIIALDHERDTIVFCELKATDNIEKGMTKDVVSADKRKKYECIAALWLNDHEFVDKSIRFDVIAMITFNDKALLRHHLNCFGV